jgi:hypothetical protein
MMVRVIETAIDVVTGKVNFTVMEKCKNLKMIRHLTNKVNLMVIMII